MGVGVAIFVGGLLTLATPILESYADARMVNFSCWTPLLIIGGIGAFVMGLNGYAKEQRYLKDV